MLRWDEVNEYIHESEAELVDELALCRDCPHKEPEGGGWMIAQIVHHLVRTEQIMYLVWLIAPKLRDFPWILRGLDRTNALLWRLMGMREMESAGGRPTPENATKGKFSAPVFLRPGRASANVGKYIEWRNHVRKRSLRAIVSLSEETLSNVKWSHPLFGPYTLMEFARFLAVHEQHHLPQIRNIRQQ